MAGKMKTGPKVIIFALLLGGLFFGLKYAAASGYLPSGSIFGSKKIKSSATLSTNTDAAGPKIKVSSSDLPGTRPAGLSGPPILVEEWFWNAQLACNLATGGAEPMQGSLATKYGVNVQFRRNDDTPKMAENLLAFATELSNGNPQPDGVHFVGIMGDQAAGFLGPLNDRLRKLGPEYQAEVIYSCGRSKGEDQFMGPASWAKRFGGDPKNMQGGTVVVVVGEGDWNIVMKYARDNDVAVNTDLTTYDPGALNVIAVSLYTEAAEKFVAGYCEDRPVVKNGRKTKEIHKTCADAVSTWTPADVTVAEGRGGVVRIVSTQEYSGQMPHVLIGIKKWNQDNREAVVSMVRAFGEAGDQVLSSQDAAYRAAQASYDVVKEQSPDWILKYYNGVKQDDATGKPVELGGSRVHNLADNLRWFRGGAKSMYGSSCLTFGRILNELYPDRLASVSEDACTPNVEYVQEALKVSGATTVAEAPTFTRGAVRNELGSAPVYINFVTGRAELTPQAEAELDKLRQNLTVSADLAIEIHGYTDNTGDPGANQRLSEARAFAVKQWLRTHAAQDFPETRFARVIGHGQDTPIGDNATAAGRAKNRRVEIVQGQQ